MIDGIKGTIYGIDPVHLKQKLDFYTPVNERTGEVSQYSHGQLGNLRLSLSPKQTCTIRGSLHKYAHSGLNSTDFGYSDLIGCVGGLADFFGTSEGNVRLHNIEFGVNLNYPPQDITQNLILYGPHSFAPMSSKSGTTGLKCELSQYALKVYGKSKTRLRIETQVKKMQFLKSAVSGANLSFESLHDYGILKGLGEMLLNAWDKILIWEDFSQSYLNQREQTLFALGRHPTFWTELQRSNPNNFKKKKSRFLELQAKYRTTNRKDEISRLIGEKWAALLQY